MITADQMLCHAIGDYSLQSDWMAVTKTQRSFAALCHVLTYALPFLFLTLDWRALAFIAGTHFVIDRWRLARYVCWAKNWMAPRYRVVAAGTAVGGFPVSDIADVAPWNLPWSACRDSSGYPPDKPAWLSVWLLIITDNTMHVLCNGLALMWWP